jgi:replication factor C small subunit
MEKLAIKSIKKVNGARHVYDLSVGINHNFFIGKNKILTHNCDFVTIQGQAALRNMIEEYTSICRWILTANYEHKIIPALKSRTQGFHIDHLDKEQFLTRIANILLAENVELTEENLEILDEYTITTYPDLRKCINLLQQNCISGKLNRPSTGSSNGSEEYMVAAVGLFKQGKISEARKLICANARAEEYEDLYRLLYRNLQWWGKTEQQQNQAIVIIANRLRDNSICADPEINMSACLIELSLIVDNSN